MQINGPSSYNSTNPAQAVRGPVKPAHFHILAATRVAESQDQLTLSAEALAQVDATSKATPEFRADKVAEIRAQLAAGRYESADKLEIAVDRLLERIG